MKTILLTLDYEIFGNGSGDVFENLVAPMHRLLEIAREEGFRYTIFFETIEFLRMKREFCGGNSMGYAENPVLAVEKQLIEAYQSGHDVQLHIHPQWAAARWEENGWILDENWALGSYGTDEELLDLIKEGKDYLESILRRVDSGYKCTALRAGAYCLQPSGRIAAVMKKLGLYVDSSIVPGAVSVDKRGIYDYSSVSKHLDYWFADREMEIDTPNGSILELPLAVHPVRRIRKILSISALMSRTGKNKSAREALNAKSGDGRKSSVADKIRYVFGVESQTWDFCILLPSIHRTFLRDAATSAKNLFVLVGHPKGFVDERGFRFFIEATKGTYRFLTIRQFVASVSHAEV